MSAAGAGAAVDAELLASFPAEHHKTPPLTWERIHASFPIDPSSPIVAFEKPAGSMQPSEMHAHLLELFPELAAAAAKKEAEARGGGAAAEGEVDEEQRARAEALRKKMAWHAAAMETYVPMHAMPHGTRKLVLNRVRHPSQHNGSTSMRRPPCPNEPVPNRGRFKSDRAARLLGYRHAPTHGQRNNGADGTFDMALVRYDGAAGDAAPSRPTFDRLRDPPNRKSAERFDPYGVAMGRVNGAEAAQLVALAAGAMARQGGGGGGGGEGVAGAMAETGASSAGAQGEDSAAAAVAAASELMRASVGSSIIDGSYSRFSEVSFGGGSGGASKQRRKKPQRQFATLDESEEQKRRVGVRQQQQSQAALFGVSGRQSIMSPKPAPPSPAASQKKRSGAR